MKFKIGDEVYLSEDSEWNNGSKANPLNVLGVIDDIDLEDNTYGIMWSNGIHNSSYTDDCLYPANQDGFQVGDWVVVVDNTGRTNITLGKIYKVMSTDGGFVHIEQDCGRIGGYLSGCFKLASEIEQSATPTKITVEITQEEYDSLIDEVNLLRELLAEANGVVDFDKPITKYTLEDCKQAIEEGAVFENANGTLIKLFSVCLGDDELYPVVTSLGSFTVSGLYYTDGAEPQRNIIRRIK